MSKYSVPERISIVKAYYSSNNSPTAAQSKFATEYKLKTTGPSVVTIKNVNDVVHPCYMTITGLKTRITAAVPSIYRRLGRNCIADMILCRLTKGARIEHLRCLHSKFESITS
ncbi:hypothetical protein AVEN_264299-1 [Araneus ventricosus]|uniref:DUF4817 domain-containing protein n=1 Tax=Araneus ventricosus TaxID=182803 RepID=A0A4Y2E453_ARAVE|nr:hypothetical protein AVEN_264299-1 [Araneus ventricosus]